MRWYLVVAAVLALAPPVAAETDREGQVWTAALGTVGLGSAPAGPSLWLDTHLRRGANGIVHIARPGLGWRWTPSLSTWLGYAWIPTIPDAGDTVHEHRLWQQLVFASKARGVALQSRTRFEQRFLDEGDDVGLRLRQFVRFGWQVGRGGRFGVVVWDELFVALNDTDWGATSGLDQNRLFVGPYVQVVGGWRLEMGYLAVFLERGERDVFANVLATNLFWTIR